MKISRIEDLSVGLLDPNPDFFNSFKGLLEAYNVNLPVMAQSLTVAEKAVTEIKDKSLHGIFVGAFSSESPRLIEEIKRKYPKIYTVGIMEEYTETKADFMIFYGDVAHSTDWMLSQIFDAWT